MNQDRSHMDIVLVPVGPMESDVIRCLAERIDSRFETRCRIGAKIEIPATAFHEARNQYDAKAILALLSGCGGGHAGKIIGVTRADLFVPILKYVYGLAHIDGQCAVVSLHRLYPAFDGNPSDAGLLFSRAEKTLLHELGHTHGLTHCRERACVMYSSTRIADTDAKKPDFCPTCHELFIWGNQRTTTD